MCEDISCKINHMKNKDDFLVFLDMLKNDFDCHKKEWQNKTIPEYLDAVQSWIADYSQSPLNDIDWQKMDYSLLAKILYMGKIYE